MFFSINFILGGNSMKNLPESVKMKIITFLSDLPVEKLSKEWQTIQVAISMITTPSSFKKGVHVYLHSYDGAREPGCYNISEMSVKMWPHKIQIRREHREYVSGCNIDVNQIYRYIHPSDKYFVSDFNEVMSNMGNLFNANYSQDESEYNGHYTITANFTIETNVKP